MRKILIADASEIWREKLTQGLDREYEVLACADGDQALAAAERFRPDVVVLDLLLAGVDGLSLIKRLREWEDCPRFIVTGRYFSNYMTTALERYQVDSIMLKPCSLRSVAERVGELLAEQELLRTETALYGFRTVRLRRRREPQAAYTRREAELFMLRT